MESHEDFCDSLPYIDDTLTDDDVNPHQYNLKIIENYNNNNRNIEITNEFSNDVNKSLSPDALLADETEFSDNKLSDSVEENNCKQERKFRAREPGMKLVIKGRNSSVSIQGLDNKSSITFKRKCEKVHKKVERNEKKDEAKAVDKSKKGKWKILTRSIMLAKSARFERKGLDERYPKYVLLKNEEEELTTVKENYPKMFVFNEGNPKQKKNSGPKAEFSFKKSFKNKTEPIVPLKNILAKAEKVPPEKPKTRLNEDVKKQKKPLTERNICKKKPVERRKSLAIETKEGRPTQGTISSPFSHGQVCSEIQNIFEDTLKLSPQGVELQQADEDTQGERCVEYFTSVPPPHGPYCCLVPQHQPSHSSQKGHTYKNPVPQSHFPCLSQEIKPEDPIAMNGVLDLESLPFGILSSFFPRVVIMNAIRGEDLQEDEMTTNEAQYRDYQLPTVVKKECGKAAESLEVPQQDLTLKSKAVKEIKQAELQDFCLEKVSLKEFSVPDEDQKTKSQCSETTEYLQYSEFEPARNESVERPNSTTPPPKCDIKQKEDESLSEIDKFKTDDVDENSENLSLTKIGYKMYDNLTKLSLNREKEMSKKAEASGCGCNGNGTKKSPYNITLESNNSVVKVTVPENELNFQIINSEGGDIHIGVMSEKKRKKDEEKMKKLVTKEELWHTDGERRALVLKNECWEADSSKGSHNFKVSLGDSKEVMLSIEMNETDKRKEKMKKKSTREVKVGTDDFDIAGGNFVCTLDGNYKNLSPRIAELLKHLHEKLEADGKERKFLDEKINQKLIDQKFQFNSGILPGVFLVKHISPRPHAVKKPSETRKSKNDSRRSAGSLREYYCEECLATMRIFEDENPSVKSMVDKFETIIQLESC